jgi:hypothetical protein
MMLAVGVGLLIAAVAGLLIVPEHAPAFFCARLSATSAQARAPRLAGLSRHTTRRAPGYGRR